MLHIGSPGFVLQLVASPVFWKGRTCTKNCMDPVLPVRNCCAASVVEIADGFDKLKSEYYKFQDFLDE